WRIMYIGNKNEFSDEQLSAMATRKLMASNIKTPHETEDLIVPDGMEKIDETSLSEEAKLFNTFCSVCHQRNGRGNDRFPPLNDTEWVLGDKETLVKVIFNGLSGKIIVKEKPYYNTMPKLNMLSDEEIAKVLTYIGRILVTVQVLLRLTK
ncbi:MAG: cytochrome c, partial [Cyclobacteriaceae bacterium]|nr:cytochrome c [Cyclobacteriaceae bacterium]